MDGDIVMGGSHQQMNGHMQQINGGQGGMQHLFAQSGNSTISAGSAQSSVALPNNFNPQYTPNNAVLPLAPFHVTGSQTARLPSTQPMSSTTSSLPPTNGLSALSLSSSSNVPPPSSARSGMPQTQQQQRPSQSGTSSLLPNPNLHSLPSATPVSSSSTSNPLVSSSSVTQQSGLDSRKSKKPKPVTKPPKQPMTPAETMKKYGDLLTPFEQSEILEYQHIYFVGTNTTDKIKGIPHTGNNNGYDDDRGDYKIVLNDHLEYRYEVLNVLGRGSFGQVLKVIDHKKDMIVALKIIRNKKRFHHQALVEVKILEHLMSKVKKEREHTNGVICFLVVPLFFCRSLDAFFLLFCVCVCLPFIG